MHLSCFLSLLQSMTLPKAFFVLHDLDIFEEWLSIILQTVLQFVLSNVFSPWDWSFAFLKRKPMKRYVLLNASCHKLDDDIIPLLIMLILITWLRLWLPSFFTVKLLFFPLLINISREKHGDDEDTLFFL